MRGIWQGKEWFSIYTKKQFSHEQITIHLWNKNRINAFGEFTVKAVNQCFKRISLDNDNLERIKEYSFKIIHATKQLLTDYQEALGVIPPKGLENVNIAFTNFYNPIFNSLRKFANDINDAKLKEKIESMIFV